MKLLKSIKKVQHFLTHHIWNLRLDRVDKKKGLLIKQMRILTLAVKGFNEDKCLLKSSALTYYTLFSIVPVAALLFALAKGFGQDAKLELYLRENFSEYEQILNQVFTYAHNLLANTNGGLMAAVGILLLFWTVMKLLGSIEDSFNEIWEIKKGRTFIRKFTDYLSIMLLAPVLIVLSGGITVIIKSQVSYAVENIHVLQQLGSVVQVVLRLLSMLLMSALFVFIYMVLPNTRVNFKSAFWAGLIAGCLFELAEWAYLSFQIGAVRYNAIYGSFAALPLFLIWVQYSWFIVLFGAELAFANQNVDHYELENEIQKISIRYKRILSLLVANRVVKQFTEAKPALTAIEIAESLDLPVRLVRNIIFDFTEAGLFSEVKLQSDKEIAYQPALSDAQMTVGFVIGELEKLGVNEIPMHKNENLEAIQGLIAKHESLLQASEGNVLVQQIR